MSIIPENKIFRWKNKNVTEKVFLHRKKLSGSLKRKLVDQEEEIPSQKPRIGTRIVNMDILRAAMKCRRCKKPLSFDNIVHQERKGAAEIYRITCDDCSTVNFVPTSDHCREEKGKKIYNVNCRVALGAINAGIGCDQLNKFLADLNVPTIDDHNFKRHERIVGPEIEKTAKDSCRDAAKLEKELVLNDVETLINMIPTNLDKSFILPDLNNQDSSELGVYQDYECLSSPDDSCLQNQPPYAIPPIRQTIPIYSLSQRLSFDSTQKTKVLYQGRVRIAASYDMAWFKRGAGRNYDSLSGYGCLFGFFTGRIIDYGLRNRKCKKCDIGHPPEDHDCRRNYAGAAKGMESDLAVALTCDSDIMKELNLELGILIGDDDSSSTAKIRKRCQHSLVKLTDPNHTGKGLTGQLFKLKKEHGKTLTTEGIAYFKRCFSSAVKQNEKQPDKVAQAIRSIPLHAFNNHDQCLGSWCRYNEEKENYDHITIPGGFKDESLLKSLVELFDSIASRAGKFSHGASTQLNENFHHVATSRAPKTKCYALSEAGDFRVAASVCSLNIGPSYPEKVGTALNFSPSTSSSVKFYDSLTTRRSKRREKIATRGFKARRRSLDNERSALKYRLEREEGASYAPGMGFIDHECVNECPSSMESSTSGNDDWIKLPYTAGKYVIFDLETTDLSGNADIVQIGALCDSRTFNVYIKPSRPISARASVINLLKKIDGELFYAGSRVKSETLRNGLIQFQHFLSNCEPPCTLIAHNCKFDKLRLVNSLEKAGIFDEFEPLISGFVDSLEVFKNLLPGRQTYKLGSLADTYGMSTIGAHNALADVKMLCGILAKHPVIETDLIKYVQTLANYRQILKAEKDLSPLDSVISKGMKKKMINTELTMEILQNAFAARNYEGIASIFSEKINGETRVTKTKSIIKKVVDFFEQKRDGQK